MRSTWTGRAGRPRAGRRAGTPGCRRCRHPGTRRSTGRGRRRRRGCGRRRPWGAQQPHLGGVGVLVLVDIDGVVPVGEQPGGLGALSEEHRAVDEFGVVEDALQVEDVEVLGEEGGGGAPVGAADAAGEGVEGLGAEPEFAAAGEDRADLVGEAAGGQAGAQLVRPAHVRKAEPFQVDLAGEEPADGDVLLGSREQAQRLDEQVAVLVGADQGVAEGVERGRLRGLRRADAQGHAVTQFDGRLAAEGEHQNALGGRRRGRSGRPRTRPAWWSSPCRDPPGRASGRCRAQPRSAGRRPVGGFTRAGGVRTSR